MICIPKISGTCAGSMNAVNLAFKVYDKESKKKNPKSIFILKEILHNERVIKDLETKGIFSIETLDKLPKNSILIIRAHGEPKSIYDELEKKKIEYYDATCPKVKNIHDLVFNKSSEGYTILIIGKKSHPEVIGTLGWCNDKGIALENEDDVNKLKAKCEKVLVISQTTIDEDKFTLLSNKIKDKYKNAEVTNTICHAQKNIQDSSIELAKEMDLMFVIGGENSSNTEVLYQKCKAVKETLKFSNIHDFYKYVLQRKDLNKNLKIGLTGGASTPMYQILEYKNLLEFVIFYKEMKTLFEKEMESVNNSFKNKNDNNIVKDLVDKFININKDGKYIRASLIALGYKLGQKKEDNDFIKLALAYETFQTAILVHDDIIDNATMRRNKETIPETYIKDFSLKENRKDYIKNRKDIANGIGICAGDLGFYFANKIIIDNYKNNKNFVNVFSYYNDIVIKTIKGEIIDVLLPFKEKYKFSFSKESDVFEIYHLKTAWYTIIGPFILGLLLSGNNKNIKEIEKILNYIGIAFQIKDDIIGIFNSKELIGKSNQSDINEFKQTVLYTYVMENDLYKEELLKYYGKENLSDKELEIVRNIFIKSGAYKYANDKMNELFENAEKEISNSNIFNENIKNILLGLIIYLKIREK